MDSVFLQTVSGGETQSFNPGDVTLIVGPNGVGKSALLQDIFRKLPQGRAAYYPGHRQITFSHGWESLNMSLVELEANLFSQVEGHSRFKSFWPEEQFKSIIRRLQNLELAYNQDLVAKVRSGGKADVDLAIEDGPFHILNNIFSAARMSVRFYLSKDGFTAKRGDSSFGIDRLSDGERAALLLVGAVIVATDGSVVIVDEPERHLHPSISSPLISAIVRARPKLSYVMATHDLNLIEALPVDKIIYLRDSVLISETPEIRQYVFSALSEISGISDDLRRDVLGARDKVLFVEGEPTSLDMPIYSACFPDWKVSPRGGHEKVQEAVRTLSVSQDMHWMDVIGIIDGDGRSSLEVSKLRDEKIITLPVPSVENLFFLEDVVQAYIDLMISVEGGDKEQITNAVKEALPQLITSGREDIVARRVTWIVNRLLSEAKVSVKNIKSGLDVVPPIEITLIRSQVEQELTDFLANGASLPMLERLPIKSTGIPQGIVNRINLSNVKRYKQAVLRQIELNSEIGQRMRSAIQQRLPVLP